MEKTNYAKLNNAANLADTPKNSAVSLNKKPGLIASGRGHLLLLLYLPVYIAAFLLLEHHITSASGYWVSYWPALDDYIPFRAWFVIPYYIWYPYIVVTGLYFLFCDVPTFRRYMYSVIIGYSFGLLVCALFPNGQDLRPALTGDTLCTRMILAIYSADTNTNVLPSMHVIGTLAVVSAVLYSEKLRSPLIRVAYIVAAVLVCASTVYIKQHSILDIFAGILVGMLVHILVYTWPARKQRKTAARL